MTDQRPCQQYRALVASSGSKQAPLKRKVGKCQKKTTKGPMKSVLKKIVKKTKRVKK